MSKVEDKAKEILSILQEQNVDLENIDYDKLEELLITANRKGNLKIVK
jgi:hypothetical protein